MRQPNQMDALAFQLYHLFWQGVDWVYPPHCGGCGASGSRWCTSCDSKTQILTGRVCPKCGAPSDPGSKCRHCSLDQFHFAALRSWAVYDGPLRKAIHRLKYHRDISLAEVFSHRLASMLNQLSWDIDYIMPVPLSRQRYKERGYNQASILAWNMAMIDGIRYSARGLIRNRDTASQVGLKYGQRDSNVSGAFAADPGLVSNRSILVVDDVATSGATLNACSVALVEAGARLVYCITLARAI